MALIAMTVSDTVEHVSVKDPARTVTKVPVDENDPSKGMRDQVNIADGATKFFLKPLDVFLMGYIYDNASSLSGKEGSDEIGIKTRVNQTNIDAVRHGLAGFQNFLDAKGTHIKFSTVKIAVNGREYEVADDETMKKLGIRLIQELAARIKEISEVSAEEEKN
ncbi:hypothetical protein [Nitratireductor sp. OM-1]|uniref:hypothetical protein n=1 Tax=Nitratireductor sp. OM-1 TaxID=1756988 RepID=UPI000DDDBCED|nr:hypothetical protein [Nitratireductor sp. OM-1]